MYIRGDFTGDYKFPWVNWIALVWDHTIPFILMMIEWQWSAIPIDWHRYPIYIGVGFIYLSVTVAGSLLLETAIYASMNWICDPLIAVPVVMCVLLG